MRRPSALHDPLELCAQAGALLKASGFEVRVVSRRSEAVYYALPGSTTLLRVAAHRRDPQSEPTRGSVVATLTLSADTAGGRLRMSENKFREMVARAIGFYWLRSAGRETEP